MNVLAALMTVLIIGVVFCAVILRRNEELCQYLLQMCDDVHIAGKRDIHNGCECDWRYEAMRKVSYNKILYTVWRNFDSFYPDKSFMEIGESNGKS
jgi:hypothetical protein